MVIHIVFFNCDTNVTYVYTLQPEEVNKNLRNVA